MDIQKLLEDLQKCFFKKLDQRSAWDKQQVKLQFRYAIQEILINKVEELEHAKSERNEVKSRKNVHV